MSRAAQLLAARRRLRRSPRRIRVESCPWTVSRSTYPPQDLNNAGLKTSGINSETGLVEIIELPTNNWFIGVQFHPEYKSTVETPHPLFVSFVQACLTYNNTKD